MADTKLVLKVDAGKDVLYVFDKTGKYSSKNTSGWGLPNSQILNVTSAEARIFLPKSTTYTSVNLFPSLPNTTGVGFEIVPTDLGLTTLPAGIYKIQYYIELLGGDKKLSQTVYYFYYMPLSCCVSTKKMAICSDDYSSDKVKEVLELETLLENAIWASCSGDLITAEEISDYLVTKCDCCC